MPAGLSTVTAALGFSTSYKYKKILRAGAHYFVSLNAPQSRQATPNGAPLLNEKFISTFAIK